MKKVTLMLMVVAFSTSQMEDIGKLNVTISEEVVLFSDKLPPEH